MKLVIDMPAKVYEMAKHSNILESNVYPLARCVKRGKPVIRKMVKEKSYKEE